MSTSVVRSCIANSTIKEMITNRKLLRTAISKEMFDVVKGWGVWLETVEITGVTICSKSLFTDLQTNYRETIRQQSVLFTMQIKDEIDAIKNKNSIEVAEKERENQEKERIYREKINLELKEGKEQFYRQKMEIEKERETLNVEAEIFRESENQALQKKFNELSSQRSLEEDKMWVKNNQEQQRITVELNKTSDIALDRSLESEKQQNDAANELKRLDMELEKEIMDKDMLTHEAMTLAKKCYAGKFIERTNITNMSNDDPSSAVLAGLLQKLDITKNAIAAE